MNDMQCMLQISPARLLMGGHQDKIIDFNLARGKETGLVRIYQLNVKLIPSTKCDGFMARIFIFWFTCG